MVSVTETIEVVEISDIVGISRDFEVEVLGISDIFDLVSVLGGRSQFPRDPIIDSRLLNPELS